MHAQPDVAIARAGEFRRQRSAGFPSRGGVHPYRHLRRLRRVRVDSEEHIERFSPPGKHLDRLPWLDG